MKCTSLESYRIENYKSIEDSGKIRLNSTSVILGPNSSGKTNLMEPLLLLKQSMNTRGMNLSLNGEHIKLGKYEDIVNEQDVSKDISYTFYFDYINEPKNEDRPLECPICGKNYKEEGWYKKHIRNDHEIFWEYKGENLSKYEEFPNKNPYVDLTYTHDSDSNSNRVKKVTIGYPAEVGSLFLSSITLEFDKNSIRLCAKDLDENTVFDSEMLREEFGDLNCSRISEIDSVMGRMLAMHTTSTRRIFPRYSTNQPYIQDQKLPLASEEFSKLSELCKETIEDTNGDEYLEEYSDQTEKLLNGLIMRMSTIADNSMYMLRSVEALTENTSHVGPLRRSPQRIYSASGANLDNQYFRGVDIEKRLFSNTDGDMSPILKKTNEWLKKPALSVS